MKIAEPSTNNKKSYDLADYMNMTNRNRNTNDNDIPERFRKKKMTTQEASDYINYLNSRPRNNQQQQQQVSRKGKGITLADLMNQRERRSFS